MGMTRQESELAVFGKKASQLLLAIKSAIKAGNEFCCLGSLMVYIVQDVTFLEHLSCVCLKLQISFDKGSCNLV